MAGSFLAQIARAREAATPRAASAPTPVEEMSGAELDQALVEARREAVEAHKAVAAVASEYTRPPTLAAKFRELQRGKKHHWR